MTGFMDYFVGTKWSETFLAGTVTSTLVLLLSLLALRRRRGRRPPGPYGWPIVGSLFSLAGKNPHESFRRLSVKYGPLMWLNLGSVPTLVVSSASMGQEVFKTHDIAMCSRPPAPRIPRYLSFKGLDIFWSNGKYWRDIRKFLSRKVLSMSNLHQIEGVRRREVMATLDTVLHEAKEGKLVNMTEIFFFQAMNNVTDIIMGKKYYGRSASVDAEESARIRKLFREIFVIIRVNDIADFIPFLAPFDPQKIEPVISKIQDNSDIFLQEIIDDHRKTPVVGPPDFVDQMLEDNPDNPEFCLSTDAMKAVLMNMLGGGTDTTSITNEWAIAELLKRPDLMKRLQDELDSVIGPDRLAEESDIPNLKFLQAVVKETLRMHPPLPLALPHATTADVQIEGYHIPAKTQVIINLYAIQRDPLLWERPNEFDPDRFLNSPKTLKGQDYDIMPFGSGRRQCPGMNLGLLMVQYPLAVLVHAVEWELPDDQKNSGFDVTEAAELGDRKLVALRLKAKPRLRADVIYGKA